MNANFHFHPSQNSRIFFLNPYYLGRIDKITGKEVYYKDGNCPVRPFIVESFYEIRAKICSQLNLHPSCNVTIDSIGEDMYDEGVTFGNSLTIHVSSADYDFDISVDCYTSFNAYQWLENNLSK